MLMKIIIALLMFMFPTSLYAKNKDLVIDDTAKNKITREASFPGGIQEWKRYLEKNMSKELADSVYTFSGTTTVVVSFVVEKDGSISGVTVGNSGRHHPVLVAESIRIIKNSPKWLPALKKGKPVRAYYKQSIIWEPSGSENN
jgi:periplasmic protein TonB